MAYIPSDEEREFNCGPAGRGLLVLPSVLSISSIDRAWSLAARGHASRCIGIRSIILAAAAEHHCPAVR